MSVVCLHQTLLTKHARHCQVRIFHANPAREASRTHRLGEGVVRSNVCGKICEVLALIVPLDFENKALGDAVLVCSRTHACGHAKPGMQSYIFRVHVSIHGYRSIRACAYDSRRDTLSMDPRKCLASTHS